MRLPLRRGAAAALVSLGCAALPARASEPRADASLLLSITDHEQFDDTDIGVGSRLSFRITNWLAADGEIVLAPGDLGDPAASGSRTEGLFGVRLGPALGRTRVYASGRAGFVRFGKPPEPFACILIYPPPLVCQVGGETVLAFNLGAGFEALLGGKTVLRLEAGDALLRYPGPVLGKDFEVATDHLWSHNLRFTASVGLRF